MDVMAKKLNYTKRHLRVRKKVIGTNQRPRLSVFRSQLNLSAQAIDDIAERTLFGVTTLSPDFRKTEKKHAGNIESAKAFGIFLAEGLKKRGITQIVFDRGGRPYLGRIRALAESLRENGINF